ncbi:unnamed protein product [Lymnaea stagnalis]|uniref:Fibrocystin-L n=1 Tax=Lymnaea stagnalis TaxID=6523 RepID=A0AAV2GWV3_LYMST
MLRSVQVYVGLVVWSATLLTVSAAVPKVYGVTPQCGSQNGGTRITVTGENFARNYFNYGTGNDNLGSKVSLAALTTYDCDLHPDGSHETQVTCYTRPMPEGTYKVKVSVDGESVLDNNYCANSDDCEFTVSDACTPTIETISPTSGLPGDFIEIYGNIITSKYGSNEPNETQDMILRVYFGGQKCDLRNEANDSMYGISFVNSKGYMKCKTEGTYIGNNIISFLVSNAYGRSMPASNIKHVHRNGIGMYQTFTEISGLSQESGSTSGGTRLTISGKYFDETDAPVEVLVGDGVCRVVEPIANNSIVCDTPPETIGSSPHFSGDRGFYIYMVNGTTDPSKIERDTAQMVQVDQSSWSGQNLGNHAIQMVGYFVPVYSGHYKFCVKSASQATLFFSTSYDPNNKTKILEGNYMDCSAHESSAIYLEADKKYYTEVNYGSSKANSFVTLAAHLMETNLTSEDTGMAEQEVQNIRLTSTVFVEKQTLELSATGSPSDVTADVQKITISGNPDAYFVLGLDGAYSVPMQIVKLSSASVQTELSSLPTVLFNVEVNAVTTSSSAVLTVTSHSSQGSISSYQVRAVQENATDIIFNVERTKLGKPNLATFTLTMDGIPSSPIPVNASSNQVLKAVTDMFSVRCHPLLRSGSYLQDFESDNTKVSDVEPFCGRYSGKNPNYIYSKGTGSGISVSTTSNRFLCLAYKGQGKVKKILVSYAFKDTNNNNAATSISFTVTNDASDNWTYWCEDIYNRFTSEYSKGTGIRVEYVQVNRVDSSQDLFVDQLMFTRDSVLSAIQGGNVNLLRMPQAQPNGVLIQTISVQGSNSKFTILLEPHNCGYNIPLFGVASATESGSTYTINNGGSVNVNISSLQKASPPIAGNFSVTFKGDTTPDPVMIPAKVTPDNLIGGLKTMSVGFSDVTATGTCSDFTYQVTMLSQTGDQPLMEVDGSQVTGINAKVTVQAVTDGGLWFDPIMGDLLRTYHTRPQVIAFINRVPTRCQKGTSCAFTWSATKTPTITQISPASGTPGNPVQISGNGFDSTNENNYVFIGSSPCIVTDSTESLITCTVGNGTTGSADVQVRVDKKGLANGSLKFTFVTGVNSLSPKFGSVGGGTLLTINGYGFTPDASVKIEDEDCRVQMINQSQITCRTPLAPSPLVSTVVEISVIQPGSSLIAGNFTYEPDTSYTPVVTAISTSTSNIWGGEKIIIDGQRFGNQIMPVKLGGKDLIVESYNETMIAAVLPPLPDGAYKLIIDVQDLGYADLRINNISDIVYTFQVTGMSPQFGSLYGGTDLFITGRGFSTNTSVMNVSVGPHKCDISEISQTSIKCRIAKTGKHIDVSATGVHKIFGYGYAWDKDPITIEVGDHITWHWETPQYVSDIGYSIQQTATPFDLASLPGGFNSGPKTRKGSFTYRFTSPGNYYYWTGYMDSADIVYFRGTVKVETLKSYSTTLSVKLSGYEASYDASGSSQEHQGQCPSLTKTLPACIDSLNLVSVPGKFYFNFLECYSPYIDSISKKTGTFTDTITFTGKGFGTELCQNEVLYADSTCDIVSSTNTTINFRISPDSQPPVGEIYEFTTRISNLGYAIVTIPNDLSRRFGLQPMVSRITPSTGSQAGGTKITVTGAGFVGDTETITVEADILSCDVESVNYTEIICETKCGSACNLGSHNVSVSVLIKGQPLPAVCEGDSCTFTSTEEKTATVTSISPNSVSEDSTTLTITGSKFGVLDASLKVKIGGRDCIVTGEVTDTEFKCTVRRLPVGDNKVEVYVKDFGIAATTVKVTSKRIASIAIPTSSSIYGGALMVIDGNGFTQDASVFVDGVPCPVISVILAQLNCTLPLHAEGKAVVSINANSIVYDNLNLTYSTAATPKVSSVTPDQAKSGDSITLSGSLFNSPTGLQPVVKIGGVECVLVAATETSINCLAGPQLTGQFLVEVFVDQLGFSNQDVKFTYKLGNFTISPVTGTTNGGQRVTLSGSGFLRNRTAVTICGAPCTEVNVTTTEYICKTSSHAAGTCEVIATVENVTQTLASAYTYDATLESTVSSVSPSRGGTGGGTVLTITGTNFGSSLKEISVTIAGVVCDVGNVTDTQITCRTGAASSAVVDVEVQRNNWGITKQINAKYEYIDLWSNKYTWGGESPPTEGDFVVIPAGKTILLDANTPVLKMLLIQGGRLIFDEANVELQAENILITNGGLLQIGTAEKPFPKQYTAIITLHGHLRSKELPIYGTKTLAVREGTLDLYGSPIAVVWTRLAATAAAGTKTLKLQHSVDWQAGDEIVIATTGDRMSQKESEVKIIESVNGDEVNLTESLVYEHLGITGQWGSQIVEFRAEVGLLKRNVVIRGNRNDAFDTTIPACPAGFNPGEFATQTCFQGRFGEEVGSDQFGAQIMIHQMEKDTQVAQAHIQYVELTFSGQAFRLGRYPIHFHLNGNMDKSFVRGCAIHTSFNRAVNIHGSHNVLVEYNVLYNIMGGAFFLEDGNEVGNTFQYNLAVFVRSSTSLRNDDITPAGFWATHPNNTIRHNAVAGGTHFGTWYRMHTHPDGPGFDPNICPQAAPLKEYRNNTAHSLGWFGLWIFETYIPRAVASCSSSAAHQVAKFYSLTAWNCEKGAEAVNIGAVQFHDFVLVHNEIAGFESKLILETPPQYDAENGPGIFDSTIVAHYDDKLKGTGTLGGIVIPYMTGFLVKGVKFYNFNQTGRAAFAWTRIAGVCTHFCGGFTIESEGLTLENSPNKVKYDWESEGVIYDRDGSLTGNANYSVVPCSPSFDKTKCTQAADMSVNVAGCVCTNDIKLIRFAFNNLTPTSAAGKNVSFTSDFGTTLAPYEAKRITHSKGWAVVLMANNYYNFSFQNGDQIYNISYDGLIYRLGVGDYMVFTQYAEEKPDIFNLDGSATTLNMSESQLSGSDVKHGQWFYNGPEKTITYAVQRQTRAKRDTTKYVTSQDKSVKTRAIRCFFRDCKPPPDPMDILSQPKNAEYWSDNSTWATVTKDGQQPKALSNLIIPKDKWIIVDQPIPKLGQLVLEGGLQFLDSYTFNMVLDVEYIHITGRLIAGWSESAPFLGNLLIRVRGSRNAPAYAVTDGPALGTRFIGVFGGLQLHGKDHGITKTKLAQTVDSGNQITITDTVSWVPGDIILITTTHYNPWHTETFSISSIAGNTITLNSTIKYRHIAQALTLNGETIELSATVALLTRNIKIEGEEYDGLIKDSFGARIVVGQTYYAGDQRSGFAQISNVEFYHTGQEGHSESYDPRFSLSYIDVISTPGKVRYSYVKKSTFYSGFSTAIGAFSIDGLEIDGNIIHQTVGAGIRTESVRTRITNNLVTLSMWPGVYQDRREMSNPNFEGSIEAILADDLVLINNTVVGTERSGYRLKGQNCNTQDAHLWSGNIAIGGLIGVAAVPEDQLVNSTCILYNGFTLWKNMDFGFYFNNNGSVIFKNNVLVENGVGIFPMLVGPSAVKHAYTDKYVEITGNIFIGKTAAFSEKLDVVDKTDDNIVLSEQIRSHGSLVVCGKIGIEFTTFTGGGNGAPVKPFVNIMSYPTIKGVTKLKNNTFVNFNSCTNGNDFAITTNKDNDDACHPILVENTELINVTHTSKIFFHPPNVGKVNPSDCVDMDCDGLKKCLIRDLDGTFLGHKGTVLPDSAYEWDGDKRHGVGDYRIPSAMLATRTASKIDVSSFAPHKGIYKTDNCTWIEQWRAFECADFYQWRLLTIESMDADTETRRLSPVAIYNPEGYVDLVNGPQDHGWCSGYTCQRRLSTFQAIVALDRPFDIYLSSTNPMETRYMLLLSDSNECVRLSLLTSNQNRYEVKVNNTLIMPTNGFIDANGRFRLKLQNTNNEFMPDVKDKVNGQNFLSREENTVFFVVCGNSEVKVSQTEVFLVSFTLPAMTEEEFFSEKIVENLAAFLGLDPRKVRIVNIVRDTSSSGRRKRDTGVITFTVEIGDAPGEEPTVNYEVVNNKIIIQVQLHGMSEILNATVLYTTVIAPGDSTEITLRKPGQLVMHTSPEGGVSEGKPLRVQPKLKVVDEYGDVVTNLGYNTSAWTISAFIKSGSYSQAKVLNATVDFEGGWANFTDLIITLKGSYILEFKVTYPPEAANYSVRSSSIQILELNVEPKLEVKTEVCLTDSPIQIDVSLTDKATNKQLTDLNWASLTWSATISMYSTSIYNGILGGTLNIDFNSSTGYASFKDLTFDKPGKCPLLLTIKSNPAEYNIHKVIYVDVMTQEQKNLVVKESHRVELKFDMEYNVDLADLISAQVRNAYSQMPGIRITGNGHRKGSVIVYLLIEGTTTGYNDTVNNLCDAVVNSKEFTFNGTSVSLSSFITVDGKTFYGGLCSKLSQDSNEHDHDDTLEVKYIIIIAVLSTLLFVVVLILVYKFWLHPKVKTGALNLNNGHEEQNMYHKLITRGNTFVSLRSETPVDTMPPIDTALQMKIS